MRVEIIAGASGFQFEATAPANSLGEQQTNKVPAEISWLAAACTQDRQLSRVVKPNCCIKSLFRSLLLLHAELYVSAAAGPAMHRCGSIRCSAPHRSGTSRMLNRSQGYGYLWDRLGQFLTSTHEGCESPAGRIEVAR